MISSMVMQKTCNNNNVTQSAQKEWGRRFREKGFRATSTRMAILDCFERSSGPISVEEMNRLLMGRGVRCNLVTVYRQLDFLERFGAIERSDIPGSIRRYEMATQHHHHFVCRECRTTRCLSSEMTRSIADIERRARRNGWLVEAHSFSLSGLCEKCQSNTIMK
jgi:Fe2+ or Zn2+ uptake regulation protein